MRLLRGLRGPCQGSLSDSSCLAPTNLGLLFNEYVSLRSNPETSVKLVVSGNGSQDKVRGEEMADKGSCPSQPCSDSHTHAYAHRGNCK